MSDMDCLSLLELFDLRSGQEDREAREHLSGCPRCRALMNQLPDEINLPNLPAHKATASTRTAAVQPDFVRTGQIWRARPLGQADWAEVVAVLGRAPDAEDRYLVVPVVETLEMATERDLLLDADLLSYPAFLDLTNVGTVLGTQLAECLGALNPRQADGVVALYLWVVGTSDRPAGVETGVPVLSEQDPRLLEAQGRGERLRALWRAVDEQVVDEQHFDEEEAADAFGLAEAINLRFAGADAEWDRSSLLEAAAIDGRRLDDFLQDRLDLTHRRDVEDLARVIHVLGVAWEEGRPAVIASLRRSPGGQWEGDDPELRAAARSRPGALSEDVTSQLYSGVGRVNESEEARRSAITAYLADLERALDDLR